VVLGLCSQGDHIVSQHQLYAGTQMLLQSVCPRFGIDVTFVDGTDPEAWHAAVRPGRTMLLLAETPANPRLDLVDLDRLGAIAGPMKVVDSTFATPLGQRPLDHGIDLVVHSATKAIGGHNDVSLGVVAGTRELLDWVWGFAVLQGANASPFDAMGGLRGLRTLGVRLRQQTASAEVLARLLEADGRVEQVRHPSLPSHPQHELARRQLRLSGGLITFDLAGGLDAGRRFVESTEICQLATSLGGPETLVTHPASTTHVNLLPAELEAAGITPGTVRMSVGLEDVDDLVADVTRALDVAEGGDASRAVDAAEGDDVAGAARD
jgi:cystathionine beta-lyase/cystathionine gamma-synthase